MAQEQNIEQKWPTNLVLVRHGESARNVAKAAAMANGLHEFGSGLRDMDVALTPMGVEQAQHTGKYLAAKFTFDRIFASPYVRTVETARQIAAQFAVAPEITYEERIREKEFGVIDGLTKEGITAKYPEEAARREREGKYYYRPSGGESHPDVALRIHSFLGTLSRDFRRQSVLVVCHSVVVLTFRKLLERWSEADFMAIDRDPDQDVRNCSVTWYAFDLASGASGKLVLREFNQVCHSFRLEVFS